MKCFILKAVHDSLSQSYLDLSDEGLVLQLGLVQFFLKTFDQGLGLLRSVTQVLMQDRGID